MKQFEFSLERVLEYRAHLQENESMVLSGMQARHRLLCKACDEMTAKLALCGDEYDELCTKGAPVKELRALVTYINELRKQIEAQKQLILESQNQIERQKAKVVAANRDKRGLEILKDKQMGLYRVETQKENERFIDEYVSASGLSVIRQ